MKAAYNTQNVALMGRVWRTPKKQSRYHRQLLPTEILPVHSKLRESSKNGMCMLLNCCNIYWLSISLVRLPISSSFYSLPIEAMQPLLAWRRTKTKLLSSSFVAPDIFTLWLLLMQRKPRSFVNHFLLVSL